MWHVSCKSGEEAVIRLRGTAAVSQAVPFSNAWATAGNWGRVGAPEKQLLSIIIMHYTLSLCVRLLRDHLEWLCKYTWMAGW